MLSKYNKLTLTFLLIFLAFSGYTQIPDNITVEGEPVRFWESGKTLVIYIIAPVLLIGFYFWRKNRKK